MIVEKLPSETMSPATKTATVASAVQFKIGVTTPEDAERFPAGRIQRPSRCVPFKRDKDGNRID